MNFQETLFNSYAHGVTSVEQCQAWFGKLTIDEQQQALRNVLSLLIQAHPSPALIQQAAANGPIKPGMTPVVIMRKHSLAVAVAKLKRLPNSELAKSFVFALFIFGEADRHRRATICQAGCSHEWHQVDYRSWVSANAPSLNAT